MLCGSSERQEKDRAIRRAHEKRLLVDLEKLARRVEQGQGKKARPEEAVQSIGRLKERYPRVARYHQMDYDAGAKRFTNGADEVKRREAEKLDGRYLLKTDREDLSAEEVRRIYILLTRVEATFRALKSPLAERPIHHHGDGRVEAQNFLCVPAYQLLVSIEKTLLDQHLQTSRATVRETLKTRQVVTCLFSMLIQKARKLGQG